MAAFREDQLLKAVQISLRGDSKLGTQVFDFKGHADGFGSPLKFA
jgi:hypothetical protein